MDFLCDHFIDCNIDTHVFELTGIWFSFENTDNKLLNVAISDGYEVADTPTAIIRGTDGGCLYNVLMCAVSEHRCVGYFEAPLIVVP